MEETTKNPNGDVMVKINGEPFRCDCGCNVFRKKGEQDKKYICNSCFAVWVGE